MFGNYPLYDVSYKLHRKVVCIKREEKKGNITTITRYWQKDKYMNKITEKIPESASSHKDVKVLVGLAESAFPEGAFV